MFLVVSRWEALPGRAEEFERVSPDVRAVLRQQPGVVLVESFRSEGHYVVVHGYQDEAAYHAVVDDANGPFRQALAKHKLEEMGHWISSERGETFPHD
ncbi:MAG: antibiotic biosynthesis monooxygenase [Armatimonadetes bacterium]|nr:antibiotic biosynthesis monooxygenase [Armatimonadota bacterium]